jgi:uncharacterized radical SAM superfamily Fe-S cluster-containing enzyme
VAFTGRISTEEREAQRYTQGDLANQLEETGYINAMRDFYPLSMVAPISRLFSALSGDPKITATSHPACSIGTYFIVDKYKNAVPVTKVFDIEGLLSEIDKFAERMNKSTFKWWYKSQIPGLFKKYYIPGSAPEGLSVRAFMRALNGMADKKIGRGEAGKKTYRTLVVASMHFQDLYNYDVERVKRCVIHYSTPEGMFPFCAYNSGPVHRERVEKNHSITLADWRKQNKNNAIQIQSAEKVSTDNASSE